MPPDLDTNQATSFENNEKNLTLYHISIYNCIILIVRNMNPCRKK